MRISSYSHYLATMSFRVLTCYMALCSFPIGLELEKLGIPPNIWSLYVHLRVLIVLRNVFLQRILQTSFAQELEGSFGCCTWGHHIVVCCFFSLKFHIILALGIFFRGLIDDTKFLIHI